MPNIIAIGDSITEGVMCPSYTDGWTYKLLQRLDPNNTITASHYAVTGGTAGWLNLYSTSNWTVRNAGVAANVTANMRARFATDVTAYAQPGDILILLAGFNDTGNASTAYIDSTTMPNIAWMCEQWMAVGTGMKIVVGLITPIIGASQARLDTAAYYRTQLSNYANTNSYYIWDPCTPLELTPGTGVANSGLYVDSLHPDQFGSSAIAYSLNTSFFGKIGGSIDKRKVWGIQFGTSCTDTTIGSSAPNNNFDTAISTINLGDDSTTQSTAWRGLITPDLSGLISKLTRPSFATNAMLSLYGGSTLSSYSGVISADVSVYQVLVPWVKGQATWNVRSTGVNWSTAGCSNLGVDRGTASLATLTLNGTDGAGFFCWKGAGLGSYVQNVIDSGTNNGLLLQSTGEFAGTTNKAINQFYQSEFGTTTRRPKFAVEYMFKDVADSVSFGVNF